MDWLETLIVVVHVVIAVALVGLVLIQQGKGADAGAAFGGGGASQTVFGSQGSGSFLTRATSFLAVVFFVTSFTLAVFAKDRAQVAGEAGIPMVEEFSQPQQDPARTPTSEEMPALEEGAGEVDSGSGKSEIPEIE